MKSVPLRWLIVTPFVVLTLISGMTMFFMSSVTISSIANSVGMQYIKEVEDRIYDRVQDFMAPLSHIIETNLNAFSHRPELLDDLTPLASRFYEQATPYNQMTFISTATADGRYLASAQDPINKGKHNIAANFMDKPLTMEGFEYDPVHHIGSKILSDATFSYDPRGRPFYQDAITKGSITWSDIHPYYGYPTLGIGLSAPIYDQTGMLLGVTATSIALIELDEYLQSLELVDGAHLFLAEENGTLIATSEEDALYHQADGVTTRAKLHDHPNKAFRLASQHLTAGTHQLSETDQEYLYFVRSISLQHGKNWVLGILIPSAYHKRLLTDYTQSTIFITLVLFICIGLIGSLIAWYIGKPIQLLNQAANSQNIKRIQTLPHPLSNVREINSLGQGLSSMADNLFDIMQNLEKKVAERTSVLQNENSSLLENALTDELTQLYNRRGLYQALELALTNAQQSHQPLTFVLCDIDHFKRINDELGHTAGDQALIAVADNLKNHTRFSIDIIARYGGEEFILVFMNTPVTQVKSRLNSIRDHFKDNPVVQNHCITMSFGVVHVEEGTAISTKELIERADRKLYQAKSGGRDKIVI
ncbi:diguanylate cyclase [Amphritea sp. 1_MG-2023]|uniref:sensor domain-containing diguanylate cyclase n=1 Tax=Amphritea sp. 1_MG-2023 TaxID=3062670 RepID=UPI0026E21F4B|nr:sensor domain-containing diguanylate cyclase [Amphritea sp. 1_MG-2023]MDO6563568.1 diguanylate cyclase [Amphritea sp. 1_MG-2023]